MSTHRVICNNDDCFYNKNCRDCTYKGCICIDDDGKCDNCLPFWKTQQYQHEYYIACQHKPTGKYYRQKRTGAVTEYEGFTFYYEDKELLPETWLTEKRTGVRLRYKDLTDPERLKVFKERVVPLPCVCDLPDNIDLLKERLKGDAK